MHVSFAWDPRVFWIAVAIALIVVLIKLFRFTGLLLLALVVYLGLRFEFAWDWLGDVIAVVFWVLWILGVLGVVLFAFTRRWRFYRAGRSGAILSFSLVLALVVAGLIGNAVDSTNWNVGITPNVVTSTTTVTAPGSTSTVTVTETQTVQVPEGRPSASPPATSSEKQQAEKEASEWVRKIVVKFDGVKTVPAACQDVKWKVDLTKPHFYFFDKNKETPGAYGPPLGTEPCEITRNIVERLYRDPMFVLAHGKEKLSEAQMLARAEKLFDAPFAERRAAAQPILEEYASNKHSISNYKGPYLSEQGVAKNGVAIIGPVTGDRSSTVITSRDSSDKVVSQRRADCGGQGFTKVIRIVQRVVTPGKTTTAVVTVPGPTETVVTPGPTVTTTVEIPTTSVPPPVTTTVTAPPSTTTTTTTQPPTTTTTSGCSRPPAPGKGYVEEGECGWKKDQSVFCIYNPQDPSCPQSGAGQPVQSNTGQPTGTSTGAPSTPSTQKPTTSAPAGGSTGGSTGGGSQPTNTPETGVTGTGVPTTSIRPGGA
jgi:hypothetical protein